MPHRIGEAEQDSALRFTQITVFHHIRVQIVFIGGQFLWGQPANLVWNTQSRNASESMPCGGGDIGMNVWVENDDVLFYLSRSGSFDENNCLLKQGRFRVRLTPNPFAGTASFRQTLHLNDGYVSVSSDNATLIIWVDVFHPVVHVEVKTKELTSMRVNFESWRYEDRPVRKGEGQQCSYKWVIPDGLMTRRDSVCVEEDNFTFFHRNPERTIFDVVVDQQGMNEVKEQLYNPLKNLIFGGRLSGDNLVYNGTRRGHYAGTEYLAWMYKSKKPTYKQSARLRRIVKFQCISFTKSFFDICYDTHFRILIHFQRNSHLRLIFFLHTGTFTNNIILDFSNFSIAVVQLDTAFITQFLTELSCRLSYIDKRNQRFLFQFFQLSSLRNLKLNL